MNKFLLPVIIEKDSDGYFASCPTLQGCYTQGDTYEEVISNMEDAIRLHIEDWREESLKLTGAGISDYLSNLEDYEDRLARGEIQW